MRTLEEVMLAGARRKAVAARRKRRVEAWEKAETRRKKTVSLEDVVDAVYALKESLDQIANVMLVANRLAPPLFRGRVHELRRGR
ncbi:MAG: hypothetical protein Q9196_005849 [Gyalolechia fulgens]